jgi:hypothetical protein
VQNRQKYLLDVQENKVPAFLQICKAQGVIKDHNNNQDGSSTESKELSPAPKGKPWLPHPRTKPEHHYLYQQ